MMATHRAHAFPRHQLRKRELDPEVNARCAEYVRLMERGHTPAEVAAKFGLNPTAVVDALYWRGLPTNMKAAVRAYWQRQDAIDRAASVAAM
jgi:DNA-binding CsgD family transcriptional regulator